MMLYESNSMDTFDFVRQYGSKKKSVAFEELKQAKESMTVDHTRIDGLLDANQMLKRMKDPIYRHKRKKPCVFCSTKHWGNRYPNERELLNIDFMNVKLLNSFLNPRGMILPGRYTGNCAKHQRKLARAIKRSRRMALLHPTTKLIITDKGISDEQHDVLEREYLTMIRRQRDRGGKKLRLPRMYLRELAPYEEVRPNWAGQARMEKRKPTIPRKKLQAQRESWPSLPTDVFDFIKDKSTNPIYLRGSEHLNEYIPPSLRKKFRPFHKNVRGNEPIDSLAMVDQMLKQLE